MTRRAVVSVATGSYVKGQDRMAAILDAMNVDRLFYRGELPEGSPSHQDVPYAFKGCALAQAADLGFETLLWADACIYPLKSLDGLFEKIEKEGAWISHCGYSNAEWTADRAYPDLFPSEFKLHQHMQTLGQSSSFLDMVRPLNRMIPHVVATSFGVSVNHPVGVNILREYERLAKDTKAFCGPWVGGEGIQHRHDQTALSVLAYRNNVRLTNPPQYFAYGKAGDAHDQRTILLADGSY